MARIPLDPPRGILVRIAQWYSRRTYGKVLDPVLAMGYHPRLMTSYARFEQSLSHWNKLDPGLKALALMASAASIGCAWCLDFGYWESRRQGMDHRRLHEVPTWRESEVYTPLERDVMEYAEAMTATPPTVDDALVARLREQLGEPAVVELTAMVAVENMRSRINTALGMTSQGFKDSCEVPARG
ncbi:carboxymuconolactone decarboxylase family protein [Streptomyces sp. bgisy100]|uniref:carboxymuconolactone decarboxylase family protein n=1 Tax=Streptomyces sp. bgisy100 TaxID=3413783 RepID=UPI003D70F378